jgi:hypothetical protein
MCQIGYVLLDADFWILNAGTTWAGVGPFLFILLFSFNTLFGVLGEKDARRGGRRKTGAKRSTA